MQTSSRRQPHKDLPAIPVPLAKRVPGFAARDFVAENFVEPAPAPEEIAAPFLAVTERYYVGNSVLLAVATDNRARRVAGFG